MQWWGWRWEAGRTELGVESRPDLTRAASLGSGLVMELSIQLSLG